MKTKERILKIAGNAVRGAAKAAVKAEVNSTCPFAVYQPKLPKEVEEMRKRNDESCR